MKGFGSAYLWAYKKIQEKADNLTEELTLEYLKDLAAYEIGVCFWCPQTYCEVDKMTGCYETFIKKGDLDGKETEI